LCHSSQSILGIDKTTQGLLTLAPKEQSSLDEWIKEQLDKGYIKQSNSPQHLHSFSYQKNTQEHWGPAKTTDTWMIGQSRTGTLSPSFQISWTKLKEQNTLPS
jgi:hypothetical protein